MKAQPSLSYCEISTFIVDCVSTKTCLRAPAMKAKLGIYPRTGEASGRPGEGARGDARKQGRYRRHLSFARLPCGHQRRNPFEASLRRDGTLGARRLQAHDRQHRASGTCAEIRQGHRQRPHQLLQPDACGESFDARSHLNSQCQRDFARPLRRAFFITTLEEWVFGPK